MAKILTYYDGLEFITNFEKSAEDTDKEFASKVLLAYKETVKDMNKLLQKNVNRINKKFKDSEITFKEYCKLANEAVTQGKEKIDELCDKCAKTFHNELAPTLQPDKQN